MEPLVIKGDEVTPTVEFNSETGVMYMGGLAIPEDVRTMFTPIKEWIMKYAEKPKPATELILDFEYLNTAATKMIFDIGTRISEIHGNENTDVKITWKYTRGDVEMLELGEELLDEFLCFKEIIAVEEI
jgi:hypothetical protein